MKDAQLMDRIVLNPDIMAGKPVIRGTRLTVDFILNLLAHGATQEEIINEYQGLSLEDTRGMVDEAIIQKALKEQWILITNDKDFGEKVYRDGRLHRGIILLRLEDERAASKITVLSSLLQTYPDRLADSFVVATEKNVRFSQT